MSAFDDAIAEFRRATAHLSEAEAAAEIKVLLKEHRSARWLRERGWRVEPPPCPECNGVGYTWTSETWGTDGLGSASMSTKPCSRGCPMAALFYATSATTSTTYSSESVP